MKTARTHRAASAALDGERPSASNGRSASSRPSRTGETLARDDATIDAKITPELFSGPPASTGLVTRESHAWWRYAAQVDGRPELSAEDELLLNRDEEATRVATTTERLIWTQAAHPREFHRVLDDGAAIAEAIADLDVQHAEAAACGRRGFPLQALFFLFQLDVRLRAAERATRHCRGRVFARAVGPRAAASSRAGRVERYMRAPAHRRVLRNRVWRRCWRGRFRRMAARRRPPEQARFLRLPLARGACVGVLLFSRCS